MMKSQDRFKNDAVLMAATFPSMEEFCKRTKISDNTLAFFKKERIRVKDLYEYEAEDYEELQEMGLPLGPMTRIQQWKRSRYEVRNPQASAMIGVIHGDFVDNRSQTSSGGGGNNPMIGVVHGNVTDSRNQASSGSAGSSGHSNRIYGGRHIQASGTNSRVMMITGKSSQGWDKEDGVKKRGAWCHTGDHIEGQNVIITDVYVE